MPIHSIYVCAAAEIVSTLGASICSVPWTRLLESAVCRRHYNASGDSEGARVLVAGSVSDLLRGVIAGIGPGAEVDEALCKGDDVQAEMAGVIGLMASFAIIPSRWSPGPEGCFQLSREYGDDMALPVETYADRCKGLLLTIPYSILAKKIDRRIILVVNVLSSLVAMLFMIAIGKSSHLFP